ncbi:hypothetical protein ERO13_A04G031680v2 [Gossypium hirsutum]|nr:hypothetical protein ERO13_A04G031680v2 [Gossypium hirsutum]
MKNEQPSNLYTCNYEELDQDHTSSQHHLRPICFPYLTLIDILECESLKFLFPITVDHGGPKKLNAPKLQTLKIKRCSGLEEIIQDPQVSNINFQCLREIQVIGCNNLKYIFPISVVDTLGQLHTLKIKSCSQLEEIIQDPQVSHINLQSLREVEVNKCNNLKYLFPQSVAKILGQLHTLKIKSCSRVEDIIQDPQVSNISLQSLSKVELVELVNLPQLKGRAINDIVLASPTLHKLKVMGCPQLTRFIVTINIQVLEFSEMTNRKQKSKVIVPKMRGGTSISMEYLTISNFEELFEYSRYDLSSLDILNLSELSELRVIWSGFNQNFQNLTQLAVKDCKRLIYIFSSTMARYLPQLMRLDISDCEKLEQIIEKDQTSSQHHLFPNLTLIDILRCKNLNVSSQLLLLMAAFQNYID